MYFAMFFGYIFVLCLVVNNLVAIKTENGRNIQINSDKESKEIKKIRPKVIDKYCKDKFSCNANHKCYCHKDALCGIFKDCCHSFKSDKHSKDFPDKSKYSCKKIPAVNNFGAVVISACPKTWGHNESRLLCETSRKRIKLVATYMADDGTVFNSIFCAFCNKVLPDMYNFHTLELCADGLKKHHDPQNQNCTFLYDKAAKKDSLRSCPLPYIFSDCPKGTPNDVSENCTNGKYGIVFDKMGNVYRNSYCGACHNISLNELSCENENVDVGTPYQFTALIKEDYEDDGLMYITAIALSISIVALLITLVIYCRFPKLMNIGGKITFCLALSLLVAQLLFLLSSETEPFPWLCTTMGILVHYFFLVTFCWMNILAFDLFVTFSNYLFDWKDKRFMYYSVYAWLLPLVFVIISFSFNFIEVVGSFNPRYGDTRCWFNSENAKLIFFLTPLGIFKLFDIVAFLFTIYHIKKTRREAALARTEDPCSFLIYLKLSLIMGLTWTFAFLARFTDSVVLLYMFTIFNACQGLSLFLCFVLTNTVFKLVKESYRPSPILSLNTTKTTSC